MTYDLLIGSGKYDLLIDHRSTISGLLLDLEYDVLTEHGFSIVDSFAIKISRQNLSYDIFICRRRYAKFAPGSYFGHVNAILHIYVQYISFNRAIKSCI